MESQFNSTMEFLELQQHEGKISPNALHLIIQTMATFLDDYQLVEVENLFKLLKK